jgi:ubiquinone/menaquinone biosynthesis C-methylase UbiE
VLEIGSNTGFTSLEIARTAGCEVLGIDLSRTAVETARRVLAADADFVKGRVTFEVGDVCQLRFESGSFDTIVCGGALSFVKERKQALREIQRVLRPWGWLCASPLCYHTLPPPDLLERLGSILGFRVPDMTADDWIRLTDEAGFEPYLTRRVRMDPQSSALVDDYVEALLRDLKDKFGAVELSSIRERARHMYGVFNENHRYLEYLASVFRWRAIAEQAELFQLRESSVAALHGLSG